MWHVVVTRTIYDALTIVTLVVGLVALINCALQRAEAFPALGTLQKPAWLAIIGGTTFIVLCLEGATLSSGERPTFGLLFKLIALGASALYLLDVRPGLRDISDGRGPW
ncbi:MAG TPA: DUF2516 family protein [Natronosporangium sp.]|nr:DUF2516 family protein [Natronosporangium sp.]